jgi:hypothetical protein
MRSIFLVLSALALLSLGACAGMYVAGDTGASVRDDSHNFTGR